MDMAGRRAPAAAERAQPLSLSNAVLPAAGLAQAAVVDSAYLIAVLDSALDLGVIATDRDGLVTVWSEGATRLTGWSAAEALGRPGALIFTPEDLAEGAAERESAAALASGRTDEERWRLRRDGSRFWAGGVLAPLMDIDGEHVGFIRMLRDLTERHELEELRRKAVEHQAFLKRELEHRIKNLLALAQGIVSQSLRNPSSIQAAKIAIDERLVVLGRAHEVLTRTHWVAAPIRQMVVDVTEGLGAGPERIVIDGPDCDLPPRPALALSLALHELGTNAVKYGALLGGAGHVEISWTCEAEPAPGRFHFVWKEVGGPVVAPPGKRGFGSRLIDSAASDFQGKAILAFAPTGVIWTLDAPWDFEAPVVI